MEGILTASSIIIIIKAARPVAARIDAPEFALVGGRHDPCRARRAHPATPSTSP